MNAPLPREHRRAPRWRRRLALLGRRARAIAVLELLTLVAMVTMLWVADAALRHGQPQRPLSPPVVALLLIGNLVPAMGLLVLLSVFPQISLWLPNLLYGTSAVQ